VTRFAAWLREQYGFGLLFALDAVLLGSRTLNEEVRQPGG